VYKRIENLGIQVQPVDCRKSLLKIENIAVYPNSNVNRLEPEQFKQVEKVAESLSSSRKNGSARILFTGAHSIKNGCAPLFRWLMRHNYLSHIAMNGAAAIHDWEFGVFGHSTECVKTNLEDGSFGFWYETCDCWSELIKCAHKENMGVGQRLAYLFQEYPSSFTEYTLFSLANSAETTMTIHPGIGQDIIHSSVKEGLDAFLLDFEYLTSSVMNLQNGVFINCGSSVCGPMVFEKCLSWARNLLMGGDKNLDNFNIYVNDIKAVNREDVEHPSCPGYYNRFIKTFSRCGVPWDYLHFDNVQFLYWLVRCLKENE
jgi:hypothetical protein